VWCVKGMWVHEELQKLWKIEDYWGVCGVSASIAVGDAKAKKDHIAISIAIVTVWAIVMILALSIDATWMAPVPISLCCFLSTVVFSRFWWNISSLM
jgi:hypothetical protein